MMSNANARGSIGRRLGLVQSGVLVVALIGSALGYWGLSRVAAQTEAMYRDAIVTERVASDWYRNVFNGTTRTTAIAVSADPNLATFFTQAAATSTKVSTELQEKLDKLLTSAEERTSFEKVSERRKVYLQVRDSITEANTPTLYRLRKEGVTFENSHSVFPTVTRVNSTSLATGTYPARHGIMGNSIYVPAVNPTRAFTNDDVKPLLKLDEVTGGNMVTATGLPEILAQRGMSMVAVSSGSTGSAMPAREAT